MIDGLFNWLGTAIYGSPALGLLAALIWGVCSILLSPCHLASIPLIVGFISQQPKLTPKKAFSISIAFSLGILVTIGLIGLITGLLGRMLGDLGAWSNWLVIAVFVVVGLYLMGIIKLNFNSLTPGKRVGQGAWAGFVLGLIFGLALGPCSFAFMAPMLAIVLTGGENSLSYGIPLLIMYGIGHCGVIALAGGSTRLIEKYLNWNEQSKALTWIKRGCGVLLIMAAVYMALK
jgi:cytochrome c-type biogenesis protein